MPRHDFDPVGQKVMPNAPTPPRGSGQPPPPSRRRSAQPGPSREQVIETLSGFGLLGARIDLMADAVMALYEPSFTPPSGPRYFNGKADLQAAQDAYDAYADEVCDR